jgi:hypothetical protein
VFVSSQGSAHARFRRALATGNPTIVLAAAAELPRVELGDALAICLVLADGASSRYDRAAVRWHGRFCLEARGLELKDAALTLAALQALKGDHADAGVAALHSLFDARGQPELGTVIAGWHARRRGH